MPSVLVTDAGRGSAISVIRSLGRRGFSVIAADSDRYSPGFYSRFASQRLLYPPPSTAPDETVAALLQAVQSEGVDLLVPVTDEVLLPLSEARDRFAGICTLAVAEPGALATAGDKVATFVLAERLGVPVPQTAVVTTVEAARQEAPHLGWPVALKPQSSRVYRSGRAIERFGVTYADTLERLSTQMGWLEGRCSVLLQEYTPGEAHGVELLLDRGRPLAAFQHRRLREFPSTGGASSFRESVPLDPVLYEYAVRLLAAVEWTGLAMVEFKVGSYGARLMEINGRIWGSLPLAVQSGMDFPARMAELYLSGPPRDGAVPFTSYATGVRSRNLELDLAWIASALRGKRRYDFLPGPSRRHGLRAAVRLLSRSDGFDILSRDDPKPGLAEIAKIARGVPQKLRRARAR